MQGACAQPVPAQLAAKIAGAPLQPLAAGQCLLLTDVGGIRVIGSGKIWIDNLYVRAVYTGRTSVHTRLISTGILSDASTRLGNQPSSYITGVQLQGDNVFERSGKELSISGLAVSAPTYVSGVLLCLPAYSLVW